MGWASGGEVFDHIARNLVKSNPSDQLLWDVLQPLVRFLQDQDWDTEEESLEEFRDNLVIRAIFYSCDVGNELDLYPSAIGRLNYNEFAEEWCLNCEECGTEMDTVYAEFTAEGHDGLCRDFVRHARKMHGYKSRDIPYDWFIERDIRGSSPNEGDSSSLQ